MTAPRLCRRSLLRHATAAGGHALLGATVARLLNACGGADPAAAPALDRFGRGTWAVGNRDRVVLSTADDAVRYHYVAIVSDPHIADRVYFARDGIEGSAADTDSMRHTVERLRTARDLLNAMAHRLDAVFVPGDLIHNYPTVELGLANPHDMGYYQRTRTRFDIARDILDGFRMPVFAGFGNHDYDVGAVDRRFSEELFLAKWGLPPYYAVEHRGVQYIHLNNFLGDTQDRRHAAFNPDIGSLGETQLAWLEARFGNGMPAVLLVHYGPGLRLLAEREVADLDLYAMLRRHEEQILYVISGHTHVWMDFGRNLGPRHQVVAATRYDANAWAIAEVDTHAGRMTMVNADLWTPLAHEARTFTPDALEAWIAARG